MTLFTSLPRFALIATLLTGLSACGGSDTVVSENPLPPPTEQPVENYAGPAPATDDTRFF